MTVLAQLTQKRNQSTIVDSVRPQRVVRCIQCCAEGGQRSHGGPDIEPAFDGIQNGEEKWSSGQRMKNYDEILPTGVND